MSETVEFSASTRARDLDSMAANPLDVLVIGGGIVGSWVALAASLRGYRVGLVEKGDFASGTSGKTSRLIHGGLRYLRQFRIRVVREAARERDVLLRAAPDLVKRITFLIPAYRGRGPRPWVLRVGLWLYDVVSGDGGLPRRRWLSAEEALREEPRLGRNGLVRAALYSDAITDDARLVLAVARAAADSGALVANYARAVEVIRPDGGADGGALLRDEETGRGIRVRARIVVNATGVWAADLRAAVDSPRLRPTKGVHIFVLRRRIGHERALVLPTPDDRIVFVIPRGDMSLIGTTDTDYRGDRDRVEADPGDVAYLLQAVNAAFPEARLSPADVVSAYAGLRPLVDTGETKESDISRRHVVIREPGGMITVVGGKLTTARAMAEDVIRVLRPRLPRGAPPKSVDTRDVRLALPPTPDATVDLQGLVSHCVHREMALRIDDILIRRTGVFYEDPEGALALAPRVADALGEELGWDSQRRQQEVERFRAIFASSRRWRDV